MKLGHLLPLFIFIAWCFSACPSFAQAVTWTETDISYTPPTPGSFAYAAGSPPTYTLKGSGTGWNSNYDYYGFTSTPTCGNIELECQVASQSSSNTTAVAGLAIRDGFNDNGGMASIGVTTAGVVNFNYRPHFGSNTNVVGGTLTGARYLRLTRNGNTISGYSSPDNETWTLVGSQTTTSAIMPNLYYAGFICFSGDNTQNTAVLKYVSYMTSVPQVASNLQLWLRSDVGVVSTSGAVSAWNDQSSNGHNASQSTGTLQPTLTTGALNSAVLPAITFGGTQYLSLSSALANNFTPGASIFMVLKPSSSSATGDPCAFGNASNSDAFFPQTIGTQASLSTYKSTTGTTVTTTTNPLSTTAYKVLEEIYSPGATNGVGSIYVNGSLIQQSTTMVSTLNNIARSTNYIGAGIGLANYFQGGIAEILVFSAPLTASQRASVESYFLSKFGVGTAPTLDSPTFSPAGGEFTPTTGVTISQDQGATCWFTTTGATPTNTIASQWQDTLPITLLANQTVKSIGVAPFFNNSPVASATYSVDPLSSAVPRNGLNLWLRSDSGLATTGAAVTGWADASGSLNSATQTVTADQPSLVANAINGLPAVSFNGTSDFLTIPAGLTTFSGGASAFAVIKPSSVTAGARIFDFGNGATSDNIYLSEPTSTGVSLYTYSGSSGTSVTSSSAITTGQFQLLQAVDNGIGTATISTNSVQGAQSTSMNTMNNILRSLNNIGAASAGGNYFNGQLAELLIFNRALTTSEQAILAGYLYNKYQLAGSTLTPAPVISLAAGALTAPAQVAIEAPAAATIYATTNGATPTISASLVYTGPIWVNYSQTVKAIAVINGVQSAVSSAAYTLNATQYPAPGTTTTPLQLNLQLPNVSIPQDSNQH